MLYSLLAIAVVGAVLYWLHRWRQLPDKEKKRFARQSALWSTAIIILGLVITGRAHWLMALLAALIALAGRLLALAQFVPVFKKIFDDVQGQSSGSRPSPKNQPMTRQQAAEILGVSIDANADEIRQAHKKLMQKVHPDRGGSEALAKQINQAKDLLIKNR